MKQPAKAAPDLQLKPIEDVSSFILAGGRSSRMGTDKALLAMAGQTLLDQAIALAKLVTVHVQVVAPAARFLETFVTGIGGTIEDIYPGQGPLAGIHAALRQTSTALNLILAVDLPFVESRFLRYLISEAARSGAMVSAPRTAQGWQPLCAVYHRDFAGIAEAALQAGKNKIDSLFEQCETRAVEQEELERMGFSESMFENLNTPEEFAVAAQKLAGKAGRRVPW